jgi:hypothetical protein
MRPRTKILAGAALFVVFLAIFGARFLFSEKRTLPADSVGVRYVGAEEGRISLTNTTGRRLIVHFLAMQLRRTNEWADVRLTLVPEIIPPHETVGKRIDPAPSSRPWRLKMIAAEELTGGDRLTRAIVLYVQNHCRPAAGGQPRSKGKEFATTTAYWGHDTV